MVNKSLLKSILNIIIYLIFVVIWGFSLVLMIVEESEIWAIIWILSTIITLIDIFVNETKMKGYKFKYLFLGKSFKKQKDDFFKKHSGFSGEEKRQLLKNMKICYRRFGDVSFAVYSYKVTPNSIYYEDYKSFNYGNALDKQKIEFIVYGLYSNCLKGGGLYRFFESITNEPFTFEEYKRLVDESQLLEAIKKLITNEKANKVFGYLKKYDRLNEKEHNFLENYELNESNKIFEYESGIFKVVERIAILKFFDYHKKRNISQDAVKVYISKDNYKRVSVCFNQKTKLYYIIRDTFVFYDENSIVYSEGNWVDRRDNSFYDTEENALKEIKEELKDCIEINLKKE